MAEAAERRRRITIVDDHAEFLDLLRELLADRYDVTTFSGHELSPGTIIDSAPDLLIVDLRLGTHDLQGSEIVTLVRAHRHLRTLPIVVCSADAGGLKAHGEELLVGNTAVLPKPFTLDRLEEVVEHGLNAGFPGDGLADADGDGYRHLLEESSDVVLVADHLGRYIDANDVALRLLGTTIDELRQLEISDVVAEERRWTDAEWQRYQRERSWHGPVTLTIPGKGRQRMLATARIIGNGDQPVYVSWLQPVETGEVAAS
jgi:PAS domain S-box-containing protein